MGHSVFRPSPPLLWTKKAPVRDCKPIKKPLVGSLPNSGWCPRMLGLRRARQCNTSKVPSWLWPSFACRKRAAVGDYWIRARNLRGTHPLPNIGQDNRTLAEPTPSVTYHAFYQFINGVHLPNDLGELVSGDVPHTGKGLTFRETCPVSVHALHPYRTIFGLRPWSACHLAPHWPSRVLAILGPLIAVDSLTKVFNSPWRG
jgi:hypothetical protein